MSSYERNYGSAEEPDLVIMIEVARECFVRRDFVERFGLVRTPRPNEIKGPLETKHRPPGKRISEVVEPKSLPARTRTRVRDAAVELSAMKVKRRA